MKGGERVLRRLGALIRRLSSERVLLPLIGLCVTLATVVNVAVLYCPACLKVLMVALNVGLVIAIKEYLEAE